MNSKLVTLILIEFMYHSMLEHLMISKEYGLMLIIHIVLKKREFQVTSSLEILNLIHFHIRQITQSPNRLDC